MATSPMYLPRMVSGVATARRRRWLGSSRSDRTLGSRDAATRPPGLHPSMKQRRMHSRWRGARMAITSSTNPIDHLNGLQARLLDRDGEAGVMAHRNRVASKNLDVPETSHDSITQAAKGSAGDLTPETLLSVVYPDTAPGDKQRRRYRPHGSKHLFLRPSDQPHRGGRSCENDRPSLGCPCDDPLVWHGRV